MRKLYEINHDIENLINSVTDPETGEVVDLDALDDLLLEREQKLESVALYCKDIHAEWVAVSHEIMTLQQRAEKLENTEAGLKFYLAKALDGQKFSTPKCDVSFRKSESVQVDDEFVTWAKENFAIDFVTHKETDAPDRMKIKKFLKEGGTLEHCRIVEKQNIQVK